MVAAIDAPLPSTAAFGKRAASPKTAGSCEEESVNVKLYCTPMSFVNVNAVGPLSGKHALPFK